MRTSRETRSSPFPIPVFVIGICAASSPLLAAQVSVQPRVETMPVPSGGDAADDLAIWVHPLQREQSTVIATDKHSGLAVYDLAGKQIQFLPDGGLDNVDLRYGFPLGGDRVALVTAGQRYSNQLKAYAVDPDTRLLHGVLAHPLGLGFAVYGSCTYRSPVSGETYFFGTSKEGRVEQWRLFDDGTGHVDAARVRVLEVGGQSEGSVADDEARALFVSEEDVGIWRYGAEPDDPSSRVLVDRTGAGGHLTPDVEGLALYYASGGAGYLIASSQGSNTFVVYDRAAPYAHRLTFGIGENAALGIDGVSKTDGIDVTNLALGSAFPAGLFVADDGVNPGANQDFKLVSWADIAGAADPPLRIDTSNDALRACSSGAAKPEQGVSMTNASAERTGRAGAKDAAELHLEGRSGDQDRVWGEASYEVKREAGVLVRKFEIRVSGDAPGATRTVKLDGTEVGKVIIDPEGEGKFELLENDQEVFPEGFREPATDSRVQIGEAIDLRLKPLEKLVDLEVAVAGAVGLAGKVSYSIERLAGKETRDFKVKVTGAPAGSVQAVTVGGVHVGDMSISSKGKGKLSFSSKKGTPFPASFPEALAGTPVKIGEIFSGVLQIDASGGDDG